MPFCVTNPLQTASKEKTNNHKIYMMKTFTRLSALCCSLLFVQTMAAQKVTGRVVDADGQPLPYTNVVAMSLPDSAFVSGVMTGEDGTFTLDAKDEGRLLRFSSLGYKTVFADVKANVGTVRLDALTQVLGEVVVKSDLPKTRLKGEGMVTSVGGTLLEHAGTIERLLDRIPNVSAKNGKIEVFGRGTPELYINGRKVRDNSELDRLSADNIKDVEVITNPGARYDASVTSVIRITTKKAVGDGFSLDNRLFGELNDYGYLVGEDNLNMNYRTGGLDIGATLRASKWASPDPKTIEQITHLEDTWRQRSEIDQVYKSENLYARLAISYMFNENHSVGVSASYRRQPWSKAGGYMESTLTQNGTLTEQLRSDYTSSVQGTTLQGNAYYTGKIGKWGIDFNTDWMYTKSNSTMNTVEDYTEVGQETEHNDVTTNNVPRSNLVASKLVVTAPLLGGDLSFGGEYSYSTRKSVYSVVPKGIIDDDRSRTEEGLATAFVEYARQFGPLSAQVGLRYEHVDFDYYEDDAYVAEQSRTYGDLFPSVALSAMLGKLGLQLGYSADISRPSYDQLRSNINYDNRYTYEGGNPFLVPTKSHNVNFAASYKWLTFSAGYSRIIDPIIQHSETYNDDPAVALFSQVNGEAYDKVFASLNLRPKVGFWHPAVMLGVQKQWFNMAVHGHNPLDNPLATFRFNNTFDVKLFEVSLNMECTTTGADENNYLRKPSFRADLSLYKSFMNDKLSVSFYVADLFKTNKNSVVTYYGTLRESIYEPKALRNINLTVRYKFNVSRSKYKGTGAGEGQKNRL